MTETQQQETARHSGKNELDDEVELIEIIHVIWKWKFLIMACTVVCGVVAGIISYNMPKVFRVGMMLQPGVVRINENGTEEYLAKAKHIQSIIETGIFNNGISNALEQYGGDQITDLFPLKATVEATNIVEVTCETSRVDFGIAVLQKLGQSLSGHFKERMTYLDQSYKKQIQEKINVISLLELEQRNVRIDIKNIEKRIAQLGSEIELIGNNTKMLIGQRKKILSNSTQMNTLPIFLYGNVVQQNLSLKNTYEDQIYRYGSKIDSFKLKLSELQIRIDQHANNKKALEAARNNIQPIQILQPPTSSPYPIKPKKSVNVILGMVIGLFAMFFVAFFLEYIQKHKHHLRP